MENLSYQNVASKALIQWTLALNKSPRHVDAEFISTHVQKKKLSEKLLLRIVRENNLHVKF